ncbi:MAG: OsmC family protein [Planctomycetota bacterium]|jgi:TusA-related sulfurtransferase/uncharacterized OsmC-like protein
MDLSSLLPARTLDGGDLDCGSGLALLIREHMLEVPVGEVLEVKSREPTVGDDLPPWCRLTGHEYLGAVEEGLWTRYFVRRGAAADHKSLAEDKARAREYEWRVRARATGPMRSTVYCRNFTFDVGQPASFEEKDRHPSAVEYLFGALAGALATGFKTEVARDGLEVDDIEITVRGRLDNVLAFLGIEDGDPSVARVGLKCFASTFDDQARVREAWQRAVERSPLAATLAKAVDLDLKLAIV